jgi:methylmalonyl-CoA/ethylmalonyl-CoA epimerase
MSAAGSAIEGIGQLLITVKDVDRAAAFYEQVLGLRLLFRFPGMAFFECGGVRLYLSQPEKPEFAGTSIVYYRVRDIQAAAEALIGRGVVFLQAPHVVHRDERHELWIGFFQDSEGNNVALMSEVPRAGES